jgi:hypothetical protein
VDDIGGAVFFALFLVGVFGLTLLALSLIFGH